MEKVDLDISVSLETLCKHNGRCASELQGFLSTQIWKPTDRKQLLKSLANLLLEPVNTADITRNFRPLALELVCRSQAAIHSIQDAHDKHVCQQIFCVALSKIIFIVPETRGWILSYLSSLEPFYREIAVQTFDEPSAKKAKLISSHISPPREHVLRAVYSLVNELHAELRVLWDWADLLKYLNDPDNVVKWYAVHIVGRLLSMSPACLSAFRQHHFTQDEIIQLSISCDTSLQRSQEQALLLTNTDHAGDTDPVGTALLGDTDPLGTALPGDKRIPHSIVDSDLSVDVASVCGVLLPKLTTAVEEAECAELLEMVPSTQRTLRMLALGVAAGSALLLEGPVGCGKTSLVEHLAWVTGRRSSPHLMKIQLGDQTDSKALVGTYRCTDIPGEFVWQPGALTLAVQYGHWVLLEDLDYAPMDVISLLLPLVSTRILSVPGHGDQIQAHPNFRIFATLRLLGGGGTLCRQHNAGMDILDKFWTHIIVEPLSRTELHQVIVIRYPALKTVADKLLDIYFLLSSGKHDTSRDSDTVGDQDAGKFFTLDGRLISTRDLLKWCRRIAVDFNVSQSATANSVYQEALDCFCACIAKQDRFLPLSESIGTKLNINKAMTDYYCNKHKPIVAITATMFTVGRANLVRKIEKIASVQRLTVDNFAFTRQAVNLLERVAVCVRNNEPVLLVGETGTGKTSSVQYLAKQLGHHLRVINMNQQSDSSDLIGGFKPVDIRFVVAPFKDQFEISFCRTFSQTQNARFLGHIQECFNKRRWDALFKLMEHTTKSALSKTKTDAESHGSWQQVYSRLRQLKTQVRQTENTLAFTFIEGTLIKALQAGDWILLDEINLATAETLECLSGLLESRHGSIVLLERGDTKPITRHEDFRLFACMNPATDVGKKDLPPGVRNRFTELYMAELECPQDLKILVAEYLKGLSLTAQQIDGIVKFYLAVKAEASKKLMDGTGHKPCYSLRTLCRALQHSASNPCQNVARSLYEGFCLSFLTQLDRASHPVVQELIVKHILSRQTSKSLLKQPLPRPHERECLNFEGYWITVGTKEPVVPNNYVLTPAVRANLRDLARVVSAGRHPVLLQGETSVGKTSMITYLAAATGNVCTRINNHEHTDIQEYVGCYAADETGKLLFKEGVLVDAMRKGFWIILDELNMAPTDVLEALNRLLDDNRELFIAETQETVKAHSKFMLFATQNPPGQYGGRKILSRAFRNRFVELHFSELPSSEIETILHERCNLPLSYSRKLVTVMTELQMRRRSSGIFTGKQGYMTLRDLFRWADRYQQATNHITEEYFDWDQQLADNGYMLLAGRVRHSDECHVVQEVIQKHIKRRVDPHNLFSLHDKTSLTTRPLLEALLVAPTGGFEHVVWTFSMRRMAVLVGQCLKFGEPVLLVGDTGCGKTTICEMFAQQREQQLYSVNCHMHTEGADFLGGLRPVRHHDNEQESDQQRLFEWCNGPLVHAMNEGSMFLIDEISLADDSVLERLNSVLEPERTLLLAEKGGGDGLQNDIDVIVAKEMFRIVATMNPGGDYGKKELSPALRNRFTEIWCPLSMNRSDMMSIIEHNLRAGIKLGHAEVPEIAAAIMDFVEWFSNNEVGKRCTVSIRDILTWVNFINNLSTPNKCNEMAEVVAMETDENEDITMEASCERLLLDTSVAFVHGACMVFLDGLGSGLTGSSSLDRTLRVRAQCLEFLLHQVETLLGCTPDPQDFGLLRSSSAPTQQLAQYFGIRPFYIPRGPELYVELSDYALSAPTTCTNAQRLLRALQLSRPVLLEGSPGVGKTSLVAAVAKASGHELIRINLSEQTDVSDLFGADLPVEGGQGGQFAWRDGPLLRALKAGHWLVLDELNLASQSVLEGLNACLDHRGQVYIPELGRSFKVHTQKTRIFACQNPLFQGGGRKGLPRSFLNRFTQVYIEPLMHEDLLFITTAMYPQIPTQTLTLMVDFNQQVYQETVLEMSWGQRGGPWEFNLRDIFRWCELLQHNQIAGGYDPGEYVCLVYADRMRTLSDMQRVCAIYEEIFHENPHRSSKRVVITNKLIQVGHSFLRRSDMVDSRAVKAQLNLLHHELLPLESLMKCIEMNWMTLLVGPSGCGKTSLVQLVAQLCGHQLHVLPMNSSMDTTELLGGFEQMDLNRHLEEIEKNVDLQVHQTLAHILSSRGQQGLYEQKLLQQWQKYVRNKKSDSDDEVSELQQRLVQIYDVISTLRTFRDKYGLPHHADIEQLEPKLCNLSALVESSKNAQLGGTFEWIDSVLVNALQDGDWLLIDNVNFCSASVLDRLNALLEPGGVLSINERGVIDGQIPSIKPHPEFRLFMAMDPRHGEISRAMRNRGLEIYILGETDGSGYDEQDVKTMLHGLGLVGKLPVVTLMSIHQAMCAKSLGVNRLHLSDLLRVGQLTVQQMEKGVDLYNALKHSALEIYVRSQRGQTDKQELADIINYILSELDLIESERTTQSSCLLEAGLWPDALPSVSDWCCDVAMSAVQQKSALFLHILNQCVLDSGQWSCYPLSMTQLMSHGLVLPPSESQEKLSYLLPSVKFLIECMDQQNWKLHSRWLSSVIHQRLNAEKSGNNVDTVLRVLEEVLAQSIAVVFESDLIRSITNCVQDYSATELETFQQMPFDLRWNTNYLDKLVRSCEGQGHFRYEEMCHSANQLYVLCQLKQKSILNVAGFTSVHKLPKHHESCPLELSYAVHMGLLQRGQLPDPSLVQLYPFVTGLDSCLLQLFSEPQQLSDEKWSKLQQSLVLYDQFVAFCREPLKLCSKELLIPTMSLHWNWLWESLLSGLVQSQSLPLPLATVVHYLQKTLGYDSKASHLHHRLSQTFGQPCAFPSSLAAQLLIRAFGICRDLALENIGVEKSSKVHAKLSLSLENGGQLKVKLINIIWQLWTENVNTIKEWAEDEMSSIESVLSSHKLLSHSRHVDAGQLMEATAIPPHSQTSHVSELAVGLLPLQDQMTVIMEMENLLQIMKMDSICPQQDVQKWLDFAVERSSLKTDDLVIWCHVQDQVDLSCTVTEFLHHFLSVIGKNSATQLTNLWLSWKPQAEDQMEVDRYSLTDQPQGAALLHTLHISQAVFHHLTDQPAVTPGEDDRKQRQTRKDNSWLPSNIPVGRMSEKLLQLKKLSMYLLASAATMNSDTQNFSMKSVELLFSALKKIVDALCEVLPASSQCENPIEHELVDLQVIITTLKRLQNESETFSALMPNIGHYLSELISACSSITNTINATDKTHLEKMIVIGRSWLLVGMLQVSLLAPQGPVDPAHKLAIEMAYHQEQIASIQREVELRQQQHRLLTGEELSLDSSTHPVLCHLVTENNRLQDWMERFSHQVATRPQPPQFHLLLQDVRQFQGTVGSCERLMVIADDLQNTFNARHVKKFTAVLQEYKAWLRNTEEFCSRMESQYIFYRDLVLPYVTGIRQVQYGISLMGHAVDAKCKLAKMQLKPLTKSPLIEDIFSCLCRFPNVSENAPSALLIAEQLLHESTRGQLEQVLADADGGQEVNPQHFMSRLLSCSLQHVNNHLAVTLKLDSAAIYVLSRIFFQYVTVWHKAEERRRQQEAERDSLYRFKDQTHGDSMTEEQHDIQEREQYFPTYGQEFEDITIGFVLDDTKKPIQKYQNALERQIENDELELEALNLTVEEMHEICLAHQRAFTNLTSTNWHQVSPQAVERQLSYAEPVVNGYQVATLVSQKLSAYFDPRLESHLLGSHLLVSKILQDFSGEDSKKWKKYQKPYDIYHDPNVHEAAKCRPLLDRFEKRVRELLSEFEDHPTLKQVIEIIQRLLMFSVQAPLMKFITGLEVLLQKAQEWQSNAARFVSLADHMEAVTSQIIEWRKLELRCWQACLDTVFWKVEQQASKWWFFLYQLLQSYILPPSDSNSQTDTTTAEPGDLVTLTSALQQFMEGSSLGEYALRLGILEAFHYQMVYMDHSKQQGEILCLLWNLHQHYSQFLPLIHDRISHLRTPIERELKGFVKIARWNDLNYYAVKAAVEKTHKVLHKHMKAFQTILKQPVSPLLTEDTKPDWSQENLKEADRPHLKCLDVSAFVEAHNVTVTTSCTGSDLQLRLPTLTRRFSKHCQTVMTKSPYSGHCQALDEFTADLISSVHDLQSLDVTKIEDKDKQQSQIKHIHLRKRKALADLFKYLQTLGLSHRKGMQALHQGSLESISWLTAEPLDVSTALKQFGHNRCDVETSERWTGSDRYYRRCISRRILLHTALRAPVKELGLSNIDRCRGFAEHFTQLLYSQHTEITQFFNDFLTLRKGFESLSAINMHDIAPQEEGKIWLDKLKATCDQVVDGLNQVSLVLECCLFSPEDGSNLSPFPASYQCPALSDEQMSHATISSVKGLLDTVVSVKKQVDESVNSTSLITSSTIQLLKDSFNKLEDLQKSIAELVKSFTFPVSGQLHPLSTTLNFIHSQLSTTHQAFCDWLVEIEACCQREQSGDLTQFSAEVDEFIAGMLLIVQKFVQNEPDVNESALDIESTAGNETEEHDVELVDGLVSEHLFKGLSEKLKLLKMTKVIGYLSSLIKHMSELSNNSETLPACRTAGDLVRPCVPLLHQYCSFVQSALTECLLAHKTSAKMHSVLLSLFTELVQKGFCLPEGYSDETSGEGATEFKDIEDGGLGEGEGVKDVSDQIETEDQLEDVRKAGEDKEEDKDHKDEPDIKGEDNAIEMSEEFDGKTHDVDKEEVSDNSDDDDDEDEEADLDKQMGDLEDEEAEKLDEQVWGSDEEDEQQEEDKKSEFGPGAGPQSETELVAKDDNEDKSQPEDKDQKPNPEPENTDDKTCEQQDVDESEYNENEADPNYNDESQAEEAEPMELPDDLQLDEDDGKDEKEGEGPEEETPNDIDKMLENSEKMEEEPEQDQGQEETKDDKDDEMNEGKEEETPGEEAMPDDGEKDEKETDPDITEDNMDADQQDGEQPNEQRGFEPKEEEPADDAIDTPPEGVSEPTKDAGKTAHETSLAEQCENAEAAAGENQQEQKNEGIGMAESDQDRGHQGQDSASVTRANNKEQTRASERRPGQSSQDRSTGTTDDKIQRRLQTVDTEQSTSSQQDNELRQSDLYEHIKESTEHFDTQTLDVATADQEQAVPNMKEELADDFQQDDKVEPDDQQNVKKEESEADLLHSAELKKTSDKAGDGENEGQVDMDMEMKVEVDGEIVRTSTVQRPPDSSIHTNFDLYNNTDMTGVDLERLREELEQEISHLSVTRPGDLNEEREALEAWSRYEILTTSLSQELCEQLRLVLQPTQASKLKGDFRTGKRLNMRKVIPYIASQFRKDKIWLRRTKPSKRQYQIMLAVDDSSSMADNHSKQLAFESISVIANALTLLEVGELSISSFGESVKLLHSFQDQFTSHSGARILQQFTFEQKKTRIAELIRNVTATMLSARTRQRGVQSEISQLLLIVSDGRGLFLEGMEVVNKAVRMAREANIFLVFVIIDNPENKDSILDIRVPVFKGGAQLPEITSYMDHFPFPFYIILRDINSLPHTISQALRQWFELVTAQDS